MNYGTLPSRFLNVVDNLPNPRAQMVRRDGRWESISSQEFLRRVAGLSTALVELGIKPGDRVVFVVGAHQLQKLLAARPSLPELEQIIVADGGADVPTECLRYETLIAGASASDISSYRLRASQVLPGQLASLIYTSGTTGEPKGVMLTHSNFCSNVHDVGRDFSLDPAQDVALSFLPLAHIYGRTLDYIYIFGGTPLAYVESLEAVAQALLEVRPTITAAVPRFFEKIYARIVEQGSKATGVKRMLFDWAMNVAQRAAPWRATGAPASLALKAQWKLADKLVYKKFRLGLGGRLRIISSGGAPLSQALAEFYWTVGIPIYQGYGLTETSPIVSSNYPENRMGSSGKPIPNVQVRAAEDGEILVKGPCVMQGYYKNPEATREVLTEDGWFRTGDIGHVDKDNYLFITDRKKDLLKTAAGKFVAPQPIENALKTSPYILIIVALVAPNPVTVSAKAAEQGIRFSSNAEMAAHPWVHSLIDAEIKRLTVHLAQYETIKRFALLPEDFTFDNGSLTFTLKLKRRVVEQQYAGVIESLYADVAEPRPILQD